MVVWIYTHLFVLNTHTPAHKPEPTEGNHSVGEIMVFPPLLQPRAFAKVFVFFKSVHTHSRDPHACYFLLFSLTATVNPSRMACSKHPANIGLPDGGDRSSELQQDSRESQQGKLRQRENL